MPEPYLMGDPEYDLIVDYAEGRITRDEMIEGLAANAVPGQHDPTGGDGYISGTKDVIRVAVGDGLLDEDDWNALFERSKTAPNLFASITAPH